MGVGLPWDETKGALNRGRKIEVSSSLVTPSPLPRRAAYVPGSRSSCTLPLDTTIGLSSPVKKEDTEQGEDGRMPWGGRGWPAGPPQGETQYHWRGCRTGHKVEDGDQVPRNWTGLDLTGLDATGLDATGLDTTGLDWT